VTIGVSGRTVPHGVSKLPESDIEYIALVNKFSECKQSFCIVLLTNILSENGR
jgi:hypothetical protein